MELNKRGSDFQYRWLKNYIKKNKFEYIIKSIRGNIIWSCDNHSSCSEFSCAWLRALFTLKAHIVSPLNLFTRFTKYRYTLLIRRDEWLDQQCKKRLLD